MYKVVMIPKQKFRPVLVLSVETMWEATELRSTLIGWGYLEFSSLSIMNAEDPIMVDTYWFWPWRKVVTAFLSREDN